jgi:pSer/pThr/pTyr-binding forkhead associated (FHA) protein
VTRNSEDFLEACGASGPLRLSIGYVGMPGVIRREIAAPFVLIGRDEENDVVLDHAKVSRRHAYLQLIGGRVFCLDLQSRTGTHREDGSEGSGWLGPDQAIRIGPFRIQLCGKDRDQSGSQPQLVGSISPLQTQASEYDLLPSVMLEFFDSDPLPPPWPMACVLALMGTARKCKVRLLNRSVSRFHCSLLRTPRGAWAVDLRRGTRLNETPLDFARLETGDCLELGTFHIRVHCASTPRLLEAPSRTRALLGNQTSTPQSLEAVSPHTSGPGSAADGFLSPSLAPFDATALVPVPLLPEGLPPGMLDLTGDRSEPSIKSLLLHLAAQVQLTQRQMFDQRQYNITLVLQLLSAWRQDQMGQIRGELARLQEVTRQLQALHRQRAKPPATSPKAVPTNRAPRPAESIQGKAASERMNENSSGSDAAKEAPLRPANAANATVAGAPAETKTDQTIAPNSGGPPGPEAPPPSAQGSPEELHGWLTERLLLLENEQQTLWQKVSSFLSATLSSGK